MVIHNLFSCLSCQLSFLQCSSYNFKYWRGVCKQLRDDSTSEPHYHYHTVCFYIQCLLLNSETFTKPPSFKPLRICCRKILIHSLEDKSLLTYGAMSIGKWLPAFQRNLLPPSSGSNVNYQLKKDHIPENMNLY